MKKKELEIALSKLPSFTNQKVELEQYQTDSTIAADALWTIYMQDDIEGRTVADLGCGNGIFGIGALLLGAKKVYFLDTDKEALALAKENVKTLKKQKKAVFLQQDITEFNYKVHTVISNPPFGVQKSHADKPFLLQSFKVSQVAYTFHKYETKDFITSFVKDNGFTSKLIKHYDFPLKKKLFFHKKKTYNVDVGLWEIWKP